MAEGRYRLIGSTASPYAIKLRALMRYRKIPFDWVIMTKAHRAATAHLQVVIGPSLGGETGYGLEDVSGEEPWASLRG